jgi:hypothetical protein
MQIRDPGSGMEKIRIRDKHPRFATLFAGDPDVGHAERVPVCRVLWWVPRPPHTRLHVPRHGLLPTRPPPHDRLPGNGTPVFRICDIVRR